MSTQSHPEFATTRINNILYRLSHIVIVGAYLMLVVMTLHKLPDWPSWVVKGWEIQVFLGLALLVPIFIKIFNYFSSLARVIFGAFCLILFVGGSIFGFSGIVSSMSEISNIITVYNLQGILFPGLFQYFESPLFL